VTISDVVPNIKINHDVCDKEGLCVSVCLTGVFEKADADSFPVVAHPEECYYCGHCVSVCPGGAIDHGGLDMDNFPSISNEMSIESERLMGFLRMRRSMRHYNQKRPVRKAIIEQVLEAARYAPTGSNAQSLEHIVIQDQEMRDALVAHMIDIFRQEVAQLQEDLKESELDAQTVLRIESDLESYQHIVSEYDAGDDPIFYRAPVVVITHAKRASTATPVEDATLASFHMMLMAQSLGLGTCYIGYFYELANMSSEILSMLEIPDENDILMCMIFGYPAVRFRRLVDRNELPVRWYLA